MANTRTRNASEIIEDALEKQYANICEVNKKIVAREMLFAPEGRMIEIDEGRKIGAEDLRFMTANALETPDKESANFKFAQSIEDINSGIDPVAEYFSWLSETTSIMNHLNDGFITKEDAEERESFLELTDQREADLMVCLGLYESCKSKGVEERIKFVRYKLQKLREMRTSIKFLTRTGQDVETTRSEYDAAIPYYKYFKSLQRLPYGYDMPYEQKVKLGISHEYDVDLAEDYDNYADIVNQMLNRMRQNDIQMSHFNEEQKNVEANSLNVNEQQKILKQTSEELKNFSRR